MLATVAVIAAGWDGTLARFEGVLLLVAFVGVLAACIGRTRKEKPELQDAIAAFARPSTGLGQNLLRFAIAVVLLYFGARWEIGRASCRERVWKYVSVTVVAVQFKTKNTKILSHKI